MSRSGNVMYVAYLVEEDKFIKETDWDIMAFKIKGRNNNVKGFKTEAEADLWIQKLKMITEEAKSKQNKKSEAK